MQTTKSDTSGVRDSTASAPQGNTDGCIRKGQSRQNTSPKPKPSIRLLFANLNRRQVPFLALAVTLSVCLGCLPPITARLLGRIFDAYTAYSARNAQDAHPSHDSKHRLIQDIGRNVIYLGAVGLAVLLLSTMATSAWIVTGEKITSNLRSRVYVTVSQKRMEWFDLGMNHGQGGEDGKKSGTHGTGAQSPETPGEGMGAGGLMAKFARETDDVRIATSQTSGQLLQYVTTCIASLALAMAVCWKLALVILASVPVTAVVTGLVERFTAPLLAAEREHTVTASGLVERVIGAIATVKAFNAESIERARFDKHLKLGSRVYKRISYAWGVRLGITNFLIFSMFVQGFWYGSHLVQAGHVSAGTVMTVFSAALMASNHLQLIVQSLQFLEKGKVAALRLYELLHDDGDVNSSSKRRSAGPRIVSGLDDVPTSSASSPTSATYYKAVPSVPQIGSIRRILPVSACAGELTLSNVTFVYPASKRSADATSAGEPALTNVSMFIPAGETTYIVGGSGSGKSTIAQLILRLYKADLGSIELDEHDMRYLDAEWCRNHIASVDQSPIIFDMSIHDNIALGVCGRSDADTAFSWDARHIPRVSREQVVAASRMALLHDFVKELPDGYDTVLGSYGASLSGGQKQRLAIARARIRDPTVLILDESTSALDPTARLLINEAVKKWRRGKTTLIITHDLAQVQREDFLYMMKGGRVVDHGYRGDLEKTAGSLFNILSTHQRTESPNDGEPSPVASNEKHSDTKEDPECLQELDEVVSDLAWDRNHSQRLATPYTRADSGDVSLISASPRGLRRSSSRLQYVRSGSASVLSHSRTNSQDSLRTMIDGGRNVRLSSQDGRTADRAGAKGLLTLRLAEQQHVWVAREAPWLEDAGRYAARARPNYASGGGSGEVTEAPSRTLRRAWREDELNDHLQNQAGAFGTAVVISSQTLQEASSNAPTQAAVPQFWSTVAFAIRSVPTKGTLLFGLICTIVGGGITPIFSYFLGKLLATMGYTDQEHKVLLFSLIVLGLAGVEGVSAFLRFSILEMVGDDWIQGLRRRAYDKILRQDKAWFEQSDETSAGVLVARIIKDAEDARNLVCRVIGALLVVVTMITAGLIWALIVGWQLTLVGLAVGPIFVAATTVQARVMARFEMRNKRRREDVSKKFYELVSNIRGVRSLALEPVLASQYVDSLKAAERDALRAAPFTGLGYGLGEGLTFLSEALIFYVGALFIIGGSYTFERMVVVFNLFIFSVTFAANTMAYLPGISKSVQATHDLRRLVDLTDEGSSERTRKGAGDGSALPFPWQPKAEASGQAIVEFRNVYFCFPRRPDVPVLEGVTFDVRKGEKIAVVGPSGCGKSTVAALIQRLYEPGGQRSPDGPLERLGEMHAGSILLEDVNIADMDVAQLRERIAVVSQNADLFDMSVRDNVSYGGAAAGLADTEGTAKRKAQLVSLACHLAQASDFIEALPRGYDTPLGEGACLLSGGQRQRLATARALFRILERASAIDHFGHNSWTGTGLSDLLILDEATSALDDLTRMQILDVLLRPARRTQQPDGPLDRNRSEKSRNGATAATIPSTSLLTPMLPAPQAIEDARRHLQERVTTIIVTHKLDEMRRCDRIVVLEAGRVAQVGPFAELMAVRGGAFHRLATAGEWGGVEAAAVLAPTPGLRPSRQA
ncbi:unnamed protein product [Parajaminaea phylloscopi]